MPLTTMWTLSAVSKCGWAFSSVTRPWVAQRVCPMPVPAWGRSASATGAPAGSAAGWRRSMADRSALRFPTARTASIRSPASTEMPALS